MIGYDIWRTKDGRDVAVRDMDTQHLLNAWRMLWRRREKRAGHAHGFSLVVGTLTLVAHDNFVLDGTMEPCADCLRDFDDAAWMKRFEHEIERQQRRRIAEHARWERRLPSSERAS